MKKPNADIREYAKRKRVYLWQLAQAIDLSESAFYCRMRKEMKSDEKDMYVKLIDELSLTD